MMTSGSSGGTVAGIDDAILCILVVAKEGEDGVAAGDFD